MSLRGLWFGRGLLGMIVITHVTRRPVRISTVNGSRRHPAWIRKPTQVQEHVDGEKYVEETERQDRVPNRSTAEESQGLCQNSFERISVRHAGEGTPDDLHKLPVRDSIRTELVTKMRETTASSMS
jgi:hypothetical protein